MPCFLKRIVKRICRKVGLCDVVREVVVRKYEAIADESLKGKNILITGGSSGIGLAIAKRCIASGGNVLITGRDAVKLKSVAKEDHSGRLMTMQWDVTCMNEIERRVSEVFEIFGGHLDVLVNNAGISERQEIGGLTLDVWNKILKTNLISPVFVLQGVVRRWKDLHAEGVVLNISSMAGSEPAVDAYSATKHAINSLTQGFARELAHEGIRVNALAPGVVIGTNLRDIQRSIKPDGNVACNWIPAGRYGVPDEVAELALFMISDRAAYMTGAVVVCDGAGSLRM